jgi:hypothetical protein
MISFCACVRGRVRVRVRVVSDQSLLRNQFPLRNQLRWEISSAEKSLVRTSTANELQSNCLSVYYPLRL